MPQTLVCESSRLTREVAKRSVARDDRTHISLWNKLDPDQRDVAFYQVILALGGRNES